MAVYSYRGLGSCYFVSPETLPAGRHVQAAEWMGCIGRGVEGQCRNPSQISIVDDRRTGIAANQLTL